ncbi:type II toxin-antitoxin system RelE/ParE family toxin [Microcystis aeruginosa BLCCF108]|uniref:Type II toxin-antitoxin system RelE/ParE family toxin n=1 Tax=Microcystis aeruginosa BLCC-F108 TaxID=2755317 RepID=A0A841UP68_MICAE|nr:MULTISPECIES: type II toxin-antitoxin system RelE/ParE family toxin [Microcystis]MBC1190390.1 type II toxin-antitoxin system RelE/ParE family toxin [Microcystis aeruginosa BLCC-F108]MCA2590669.1 type II toxin-antitoxin system RelE/ParE family toxin [Microcystis sp. M31BS1]
MTNLNENINYTVVISIDAGEFFESASATLQKKLDRCFERLKINPRNHPNIKSLKGELSGYYRYRVDDYRVIHEINDDLKLVTIIFIAHISKVYE